MPGETFGYTEAAVCGHCGNKAPLRILATYEREDSIEISPGLEETIWTATYEMCTCQSCESVLLRSLVWWEGLDDDDDDTYKRTCTITYLYPPPPAAPDGVPKSVKIAFDEAMAVKTKSANAYATMLGRLLEAVCDDLGAKRGTLEKRLKYLADNKVIPEKIGQLAQHLRELRNVGAHAERGALTAEHVPVLDSVTRAVLEYVYAVPSYLETAEQQLAELRQRRTPE